MTFDHAATVCKYLVPRVTRPRPKTGRPLIFGNIGDAILYYANVDERDDGLFTLTSRTLAFVGKADTLAGAEHIAEMAASAVKGNVHHRRDIGTQTLLNRRIAHMKELQ